MTEDTNPYYYVQNMLAGYDSDVQEVPPAPALPLPPLTDIKTKSPSRPRKRSSVEDGGSFVMCKQPRKGLRLIKIQVIDLMEQHSASSSNQSTLPPGVEPIVSAQHVMLDPIDEIMDMTDNLVKKIAKRISDSY